MKTVKYHDALKIAVPVVPAARRTASTAWIDSSNPLWGLTIRQAQNIFDSARSGNFALLHYVYDEIERVDPVLMVCVERRASALAALGWKATAAADADPVLAKEQRDAVKELADNIDNLTEGIEHLGAAFFRGFSHVSPMAGEDGRVNHLDLPESWNFCRDAATGAWLWNPTAAWATGTMNLEVIPPGELVTVWRRRAIDYPAMSVFLRHAIGERDWGRFLERYGIPPCMITMPDVTDPNMSATFNAAAAAAADGRSGALPYGSTVSYATEARGTDPFTAFIDHQEKLTVLMATGGTLASLAEAGAGTLAGNAQADVWNTIVARDGQVVGNALDRGIFRPMLERDFPGKPVAAAFELGSDAAPTASELFDLAAKARQGGFLINQKELQEKSGFTLEKDTVGTMAPAAAPYSANAAPAGKGPAKDESKDLEIDDAVNKLNDAFLDRMAEAAAKELTGGK